MLIEQSLFIWASFCLGAIFGSFIGALVWRLKNQLDWINGRSQCENCRHKLSVIDLIPIFSYLLLRGHCRYCRQPIARSTFWLELLTGCLFVGSVVFLPSALSLSWTNPFVWLSNINILYWSVLLLWLICLVILIGLFIYDLKWHILPNKLVFPLIIISFIWSGLVYLFIWQQSISNWLINICLGLLPITGLYSLLYIFSKGRYIGLGDVKLGIAIGCLLPWWAGVAVLFGANLLGCLVCLPRLLNKKLQLDSEIAFGPFLITMTIAMVWLGWWLKTLFIFL